MAEKFTEKQYKQIVELAVSGFPLNILDGTFTKDNFWEALASQTHGELTDFVNIFCLYNELAAIANPLTREWAHEQYVEKEKKYYWKLKGLYLIKDFGDGSITFDSHKHLLTESEIREWGYNPEMFDKEEVQ